MTHEKNGAVDRQPFFPKNEINLPPCVSFNFSLKLCTYPLRICFFNDGNMSCSFFHKYAILQWLALSWKGRGKLYDQNMHKIFSFSRLCSRILHMQLQLCWFSIVLHCCLQGLILKTSRDVYFPIQSYIIMLRSKRNSLCDAEKVLIRENQLEFLFKYNLWWLLNKTQLQ